MPRTPLASLPEFSPRALTEFQALGFDTFEQLESLGAEEVCRRWAQAYPVRLNASAFRGVICLLEGTRWRDATASQKAAARALVDEVRREAGRPPVKRRV